MFLATDETRIKHRLTGLKSQHPQTDGLPPCTAFHAKSRPRTGTPFLVVIMHCVMGIDTIGVIGVANSSILLLHRDSAV
ncbi:hypothetical protein CA54_24350 [Symmachiella macrocystis]|uniref:Uncharacterized protein n=1 Tax=Symmachiella macrocystis TaxID=2527985 RepID=A0A5C6BN79_9PLAN|nr:hypothetical protein CA54_24350 [Symmachiella macrocystis]